MMQNELEHQDEQLFTKNMDKHFEQYIEAYNKQKHNERKEKITWVGGTAGAFLGIFVSLIAIYSFTKNRKKSN